MITALAMCLGIAATKALGPITIHDANGGEKLPAFLGRSRELELIATTV